MNITTTRCTATAAVLRTGRGGIALPGDPGLDRLLADPNLGSTAKTIATALVKNWAWSKDHCWPSDRTIADKIGKSPGHVQRCLRELEAAGWIVREQTDEVPGGRRIWLKWRCSNGNGAQGGPAPAREAPPAPARSERIVVVTEAIEREEIAIPERQRPEPIPPAPTAAPAHTPASAPDATVGAAFPSAADGPIPLAPRPEPTPTTLPSLPLTPEQQARLAELPAASRDQMLTWLATGDPILVAEARMRLAPARPRPEPPRTLPETLTRIREDPTFPALAADWLAQAFDDRRSYSGFLARCSEAWRGELPVEQLMSAYDQATGPRAKKPGALFMHALRGAARDG